MNPAPKIAGLPGGCLRSPLHRRPLPRAECHRLARWMLTLAATRRPSLARMPPACPVDAYARRYRCVLPSGIISRPNGVRSIRCSASLISLRRSVSPAASECIIVGGLIERAPCPALAALDRETARFSSSVQFHVVLSTWRRRGVFGPAVAAATAGCRCATRKAATRCTLRA